MDIEIIRIIKSSKKKYEKLSEILKYLFIDICGINQSKYYILGSYSIRKYREINDLDIHLENIEFFKLKTLLDKNIGRLDIYKDQIRWYYDITEEYNKLTGCAEKEFSIEAYQKYPNEGIPNYNFSLENLIIRDGLEVDENKHQYLKLEMLLEWKESMKRTKDEADIKLIKELLP